MEGAKQIRVCGTGTFSGSCDLAKIDAALKATQSTISDASQQVSAAGLSLADALHKVEGLAEDCLTTNKIQMRRDYQTGSNTEKAPQFVVHQGINVMLPNADNRSVPRVLDAMIKAAGDCLQVNAVTFLFSEQKQDRLMEVARQQAAANAHTKAASYAKALGVKLGDIQVIEEPECFRPSPSPMAYGHPAREAYAPEFAGPVQAGEGTVRASVRVTYSIQ